MPISSDSKSPDQISKQSFFAAALLYVAYLPRFFVGYFPDDAVYVVGARSLLQGHYQADYLPGAPPLIHFPPGYSLFLAPFVALFQPHWAWLKLTSVGLVLFSVYLLWVVLASMLPPWPRLLVCLLYAFNPLTAMFSGAVLSEPAYLVAALLAFRWLPHVIEKRTLREEIALTVIVAWAALIRLEGVLLAVSLLGVFASTRSWRPFLLIGLGAALAAGGFALRNLHAAHRLSDYVGSWHQLALLYQQNPGAVLRSAFEFGERFVSDTLLSLDLAGPAGLPFLRIFGFVFGVFVLGLGFYHVLKSKASDTAPWRAFGLFCVLFCIVHLLWTDTDNRHYLPALPFFLAFLVAGGRVLFAKSSQTAWVLGMCLLGVCALENGYYLHQTWDVSRPAEARLPQATFDWIRTNTPESARILASKASTVYLYTGRQSHSGGPSRDRQDFLQHLQALGITYVLVLPHPAADPASFVAQNETASRLQIERWTVSWPAAFEPVFANAAESTTLYRLRNTGSRSHPS